MWREAQKRARGRSWPDIDRLLGGLPPRLSGQAKLLEYELALRHAPTGQFRDVFLGPDQLPLLSVGPWILEDLGSPGGDARPAIERSLTRIGVLLAMRATAFEAQLDGESFVGPEAGALIAGSSERATAELISLRRIAGPAVTRSGDPGDGAADATWLDRDLEATLAERDPGTLDRADPEAYLPGPWAAILGGLAVEAASAAGRHDLAPDVSRICDGIAAAMRIIADLGSLHADLIRGRASSVIVRTAIGAGIPLRPWPRPEPVLGAFVLSGGLDRDVADAAARLGEAGRLADASGLPTLAAFAADAARSVELRRSGAPPAGGGVTRPLLARAVPVAETAIAMALGFLLADPSLRESWEIHREGLFGEPLVVSRFPAGLVLELLARNEAPVRGSIDALLEALAANRFRYYEHPDCDMDADSLGVTLRLARSSSDPRGVLASSRDAVACLDRVVTVESGVPVWFSDREPGDTSRPAVIDLGEHCGTVAAHLLLGLLDSVGADVASDDPDRPIRAAMLRRGAVHLLEEIIGVGVGADVDYPATYALGVWSTLLDRLEDAGADSEAGLSVADRTGPSIPSEMIERARSAVLDALDLRRQQGRPGPQEAALLTIACHATHRVDSIDPAWRSTILAGQRFDGGWGGEPFAAAPNRGGAVTWYASAPLTTALCLDALRAGRR